MHQILNRASCWLAGLSLCLVWAGPVLAQEALPLTAGQTGLALGGGAALAGSVEWSPKTSATLTPKPGEGVLVLPAGGTAATARITSEAKVELDLALAEGTEASLTLPGGARIVLSDSWARGAKTAGAMGTLAGAGTVAVAPLYNGCRAPGLWQRLSLDVILQKPAGAAQTQVLVRALAINGSLVQNAIFLPATGAGAGPIGFTCSKGALALRNIKLTLPGSGPRPILSQISYKAYEGVHNGFPKADSAKPYAQGQVARINYRQAERPDEFAIVYTGTLSVAVAGTYTFTVAAGGGVFLEVGGKQVLTRTAGQGFYSGSTRGTAELGTGPTPFRLVYFKHRPDLSPALALYISDKEMAQFPFHEESSQPQLQPGQPFDMTVQGRPIVQRCFMQEEGHKLPYIVAVGSPGGLHYGYNLTVGGPARAWRYGFLDLAGMWRSRGSDQTAYPTGPSIALAAVPGLALLATDQAAWPDTLAGQLTARGYELDAEGYPTFIYQAQGATIRDRIRPSADGRKLERRITLEGTPASGRLYCLAAADASIATTAPGLYTIGGTSRLEAPKTFTVRDGKAGQKLLIAPIPAEGVGYSVVF